MDDFGVEDFQENVSVNLSNHLITGTFKTPIGFESDAYFVCLHIKFEKTSIPVNANFLQVYNWCFVDADVDGYTPSNVSISETGDAYFWVPLLENGQNIISFGASSTNGESDTVVTACRPWDFDIPSRYTFLIEGTFVPSNNS